MSANYQVNESCVCGGQAEMRYSSENRTCRQVHCTACKRKGPIECFIDTADRSWTAEMKRLKGAKK